MLAKERQNEIVSIIESKGFVSVANLAKTYKVNPITIRRDLNILEKKGYLKRFYGGATSAVRERLKAYGADKSLYSERTLLMENEKLSIARKALALIHEGATVFIAQGTTCATLASILGEKKYSRLNVVTNNVAAAQSIKASEITVYLVGGQFMKEEQSILGEGAISSSNSFNYDIAFIGAGGVTMEEGLTEYYPQTAQLCRTIIKRSRMTVLLCDSSKFGVTQFAITDILPTVHTIITDKNIPKEYEDGVSDLGINLVKV